VQCALQLVPPHAYAPQDVVVAVWQVPEPLHVAALVCVAPVQLWALHTVALGQSSQAPAPLHLPSSPQVFGAVAVQPLLAPRPAEIGLHDPFGCPVSGLLHAKHPPAQAVSQQKPSMQCVLAHS